MKNKKSRGFTLIELLVVIAIIAVLSVVVILTLNPAELLRQSRDSNRISDLSTMKNAISLFESDVDTSSVSALGTYGVLYTGSFGTSTTITDPNTYIGGAPAWGYASTSVVSVATSTSRALDGTGWIPVSFSLISSGAPIDNEPIDPINDNVYYYTYVASGTVFKFASKLESIKYNQGGFNDSVSTDGGNSSDTLESGTELDL